MARANACATWNDFYGRPLTSSGFTMPPQMSGAAQGLERLRASLMSKLRVRKPVRNARSKASSLRDVFLASLLDFRSGIELAFCWLDPISQDPRDRRLASPRLTR